MSVYHRHLPEMHYPHQYFHLVDETGDMELKNFFACERTQRMFAVGKAYRWLHVKREAVYQNPQRYEGTWGEIGSDTRRAGTVQEIQVGPGWEMPETRTLGFAEAHRAGGDAVNTLVMFAAEVGVKEVRGAQRKRNYRREIVVKDDYGGEETICVWDDYAKKETCPFVVSQRYIMVDIERVRNKPENSRKIYTNLNFRANGTLHRC